MYIIDMPMKVKIICQNTHLKRSLLAMETVMSDYCTWYIETILKLNNTRMGTVPSVQV